MTTLASKRESLVGPSTAPWGTPSRQIHRFFCVNVSKVTELSVLENEVIKGAKCVTLSNWRGIGSSFRTHFASQTVNDKARQFALKPSGHILKEVNRFCRTLYAPYIGVHQRAEKTFSAHNVFRLLDCVTPFKLVKLLKAVTDVTRVFIATWLVFVWLIKVMRSNAGVWMRVGGQTLAGAATLIKSHQLSFSFELAFIYVNHYALLWQMDHSETLAI